MNSQNFQTYFRGLQILFFALLAGQVLLCGLMWFIIPIDRSSPEFTQDIWLNGIGVFSLLLAGLSMWLGKKTTESARVQPNLLQKLVVYRSAKILSWALIEGATMVNVVFFYLSGRIEFMYLAACAIGFFATNIPRKDKLINELDLSSTELAMIENPNADVTSPRNE
ncbi:MAG: hypothetical protein JNJ57_08275 [Saprospiraceae bacterium]|nr:hypothetical protein [Saprospiraceae bacterium]